jgi:hypothetical protein
MANVVIIICRRITTCKKVYIRYKWCKVTNHMELQKVISYKLSLNHTNLKRAGQHVHLKRDYYRAIANNE